MQNDLELLQSSEDDLAWFHENFQEIYKEFLNKIVAIKDKKIVSSSDNINSLLENLKKLRIDDSEVLIEVITPIYRKLYIP